MTDYNRCAASPQINRLTPLAASAAEDYRKALASLEQVVRTLTLIEREANSLLPKHYYKVRGMRQQPGDDLQATVEDAASIMARRWFGLVCVVRATKVAPAARACLIGLIG